jgi:hypothetical protein
VTINFESIRESTSDQVDAYAKAVRAHGSKVALATTWYSTRLQENSRRPQPDEMRSIFARLGLGGDFWDPQSDGFG